MIKVSGLTVRLGDFSLCDVSLDVKAGEYFMIIGPTGSGKTVLLETIAGLNAASVGRIWIGGRDVSRLPPEKRGLGVAFQDQVLFPHLSVWENVAFGLKSTGHRRRDLNSRVEEAARLMNIDQFFHRVPGSLSGGERQRVALARALVTRPTALLLDEPLSALDPEAREKMQRELALIHRRLNVTTIHVTHDFEEALSLGDRVAVLQQGRVVQVGTPDDIMRRPNSEFVAGFAQSRNLFHGEAAGDAESAIVEIGGWRIRAETALRGAVSVSIRPEDIFISREPVRSTAGETCRGVITDALDKGPVIYVSVSTPLQLTCLVSRQSFAELGLVKGDSVWVTVRTSAVHVF